jgi:hypothetical protein
LLLSFHDVFDDAIDLSLEVRDRWSVASQGLAVAAPHDAMDLSTAVRQQPRRLQERLRADPDAVHEHDGGADDGPVSIWM